MIVRKKIRVLVVDDSALVRSVLVRGFGLDAELDVVGAARDPYEARDLLVKLRPDVMTLDLEMPHMDGLSFLRKFMAVLPTPTIVLSSLVVPGSTMAQQARDAGAVDVLPKPSGGLAAGLDAAMAELIKRVKAAARRKVAKRAAQAEPQQAAQAALDVTTDRVIGIGASTGGVAALGRILPRLPAWIPGVVVVQHMAAGFTAGFAERLASQCAMRVAEARDGQRILRGHILVAPGGTKHLTVQRLGGEYRVKLHEGPPVSGHAPSVDVCFESIASCAGSNAFGCLLTGMGADGAQGLLRMRGAGAQTAVQDRATSAVWGMPGAAHALGAASCMLPIEEIATALERWCTTSEANAPSARGRASQSQP
jgi:two-component system, chemotaxis family, protein-glutamate methylesterase/glutaminase